MNNEKTTSTAEERINKIINVKSEKIKSFNSQIYYVSLIFLSILVMILAMVYLNNQEKIEDISIVMENVTFKGVILLFVIYFCILILSIFPNFLKLHSLHKKRSLGLVYRSFIVGKYYSLMTVYSSGEKIMESRYLTDNYVTDKHAVNIVYSQSIMRRIALFVYGLIVMIFGLILWRGASLNTLLCILAVFVLIVHAMIIGMVLLFNKNKKKAINIVAWLSKLLYKLKIVKDYESFYNKIVDNLLMYNKSFKQHKSTIFVEISSYILVNFLKSVMLYYALISMNIGGIDLLGIIIFRTLLVELILSAWPIRNGCIAFEFVFYSMFYRLFFSGYIFWGMIVYRVFEYFIYVLQYLLVILYDTIKSKLVNKKAS